MNRFWRTLFILAVLLAGGPRLTMAANGHKTPDWLPVCGGTYNLCGFFERQNRQERIPQRFERALDFSEELAGVQIDGRYGYINSDGKVVIQPQFDLVGSFRDGHAEVVVGGKAGIIDTTGRFLLQPGFARAIPFGKTAALVAPGRRVSTYTNIYARLDTFDLSPAPEGFALIDLNTGKILKDGLFISVSDFETFAWAAQRNDKGYRLLAPDGSWKAEEVYMDVRIDGDRAIVCDYVPEDRRSDPKAAHCGAVDNNGKVLLPLQPTWIAGYWNGLYLIFKNRQRGFLNDRGILLGGRFFDDYDALHPADVTRVRLGDRWMGLTRDGQIVADPNDGIVLLSCASGIRFISRAGGIEVVSSDGQRTTPYRFDAPSIGSDCAFPMIVSQDGKYSLLDEHGKLIVDPPAFENTYSVMEGFVGVKKDGKWGVLDEKGNFTVPLRYDELRPDDGVFSVKQAGEAYWIDAHGQRVHEPHHDDDRRTTLQCRDGGGRIINSRVNGKLFWGMVDATGKIVIQPKYRAVTCFENGLAWLPFDERKAWCAVDRSGAIRQSVPCVTNWISTRMFDAQPEAMSKDFYESGVLWMQARLEYGADLRTDPPRAVSIVTTF